MDWNKIKNITIVGSVIALTVGSLASMVIGMKWCKDWDNIITDLSEEETEE